MERKMTRKEALAMCDKVYSVGYCDLQFILRNFDRIGYNCGVYGWNWDLFIFSINGKVCGFCTVIEIW